MIAEKLSRLIAPRVTAFSEDVNEPTPPTARQLRQGRKQCDE
jgi:hypothetical protein